MCRLLTTDYLVLLRKQLDGVTQPALARFTARAQRAAHFDREVNVVVASSREVQDLNRRYRGKNKPTDVLSFPPLPTLEGHLGGDIVISADIAARNARRLGHTPAEELKILILHGILHLAGYDHERDNGQMSRKEQRLRKELGLPSSLIERSAGVSPAVGAASRRRKARRAR